MSEAVVDEDAVEEAVVDQGNMDMSYTTSPRASTLVTHLIDNLLSPVLEVKKLSVRLLQHLVRKEGVQAICSINMQILDTPLGFRTVRQIAMLIRRLEVLQKTVKSNTQLLKIVPYFCLGLLSPRSAPIMQDLISAISTLCQDPGTEDAVCSMVVRCLQTPYNTTSAETSAEASSVVEQSLVAERHQAPYFDVEILKDASQHFSAVSNDFKQDLNKLLVAEEANPVNSSPSIGRLQALQVLKSIPDAAKKRSRVVVPAFLSVRSSEESVRPPSSYTNTTSSPIAGLPILSRNWCFPERRAFLELFGEFKNPRVLFRSQSVFEALLDFLTVGQTVIQKLALKALFTWKLPGVRKYEGSLLRLTDETTYRDELTTLFHVDPESSTILDEDRKELLPILLRLLFGQMVNHSGANRNHSGQEGKRKMTLQILFRMQHDEISLFLDVAFGKITIEFGTDGTLKEDSVLSGFISTEKQYGLVKGAKSMLETLRTQMAPFGERILKPVLYGLYQACRDIDDLRASSGEVQVETPSSMSRNIRRTAIQCLCMIFQNCDSTKLSVYLPQIFKHAISPRLEHFAAETSQGVSVLLQLFAVWASDSNTVPWLHDYQDSLLDRVADCLSASKSKDEVKVFILDQIFSKLVAVSSNGSDPTGRNQAILHLHMRHLLKNLDAILNSKGSGKLLDSAVDLLMNLTPFVRSSLEIEDLFSVITTLLGESSKRVGPKIKGNLLQAVINLLTYCSSTPKCSDRFRLRQDISGLFNYFIDTPNRRRLAHILELLALDDNEAREIGSLCSRLNAVSSSKLDAVDYELRLEAFDQINAKGVASFSPQSWEPILQNLIFFARANDDFAIRSNAASSLRQFIVKAGVLHQPEYDVVLHTTLSKALKKSAKADSESVRADHVTIFGLLVQTCPNHDEFKDMQGLLAGNDEEASFFNNILHIQYHRRTRAMRRLCGEAETGALRSSSICNFLLPLLEKFIFDPKDDDSTSNLRGQAIVTVGTLLQWTEWSQFRAIFRRYKSYMDSKATIEKDIIKLLAVSADALVSCSSLGSLTQDPILGDIRSEELRPLLTKSLPSKEKVSEELVAHFIPQLASFIHQKDESQVTTRIPVAITTVKLLSIVPEAQMTLFLPPLLLDVAYILRSRSQDARDIGRRTLAEATAILGPSYVHWILKELRTALVRGYQLHVLCYTIHSILVSTSDHIKPGDLDHCLADFVSVVMDDIFGTVGQEKAAEEYVSSMREVKNSKSFDSMELLAKSATVHHVLELIKPLLTVLTGTITSKQSRQIDELLRRIGVGLSRNPLARSRDILTFAYQIIQEFYKERQPAAEKKWTNDEINRQRFLVQPSGHVKGAKTTSSSCMYKLAKFALDLLRSTLQKHNTLMRPENVHGFLPVLGDAMVQTQEDIKISATRTLSTIIRLPMAELDENGNLYLLEAVKMVRNSVNTNGEAAQAALKLIAAILRERKGVLIRDSDLSYLLQRIIPDLEEPDRQGVTFNFIRAVMGRNFMLPEVYDASRKIGTIMVTNQDRGARDVARGVFVHFILDYPQSKERWNKQIKFFVTNLSYQHPEGRQSVMAAIHMLLSKVGRSVAQELISKLFIPLVLITANDDNSECRQIAGALVGQCFAKADGEQLHSLLSILRVWVQEAGNPALTKTGLQVYRILFQVPDIKAEKEVLPLLSTMDRIVLQAIQNECDDSFEPLYHALQLLSTMAATFPALTLTGEQDHLWSQVRGLLAYPHPWIQAGAAGLIATLFHDLAAANMSSVGKLPLVGSQGLELPKDAQLEVLTSSLRVLRRCGPSKELSVQTMGNLAFLGRCFNENNLEVDSLRFARASTTKDDKDGTSRSDIEGDEDDDDSDNDENGNKTKNKSNLAIAYLLTQLSSILRHEPTKLTTASLLPKHSSLQLLSALVQTPTTRESVLTPLLSPTILPPLAHLTDPHLPPPHSTDPTFTSAYQDLTTLAAETLDQIQRKLGPDAYILAMTAAQRSRRERREARNTKRKLEVVRNPETAAREKRRRVDKEKRRKKVVRDGFRRGRKRV